MARVTVDPGVCGLRTEAVTEMEEDGMTCRLAVDSACPHVVKMAENLPTVNAFTEISHTGEGSAILRASIEHCPHPACPVPSALVKAVEVASGLALPADVTIRFEEAE
ncbi:MAG: hypothetical protein KAI66_15660 [Lentisphaeria bacterium]|nr:hypothetical protein [Lentisphaeria bacterium]